MKNIVVIGAHRAGLGLNGCQLIQLQLCTHDLKIAGLAIEEAMNGLTIVCQKTSRNIAKNLEEIAIVANPIIPLSELPPIIREKKPKYIRQQHKLAQRHYRRK